MYYFNLLVDFFIFMLKKLHISLKFSNIVVAKLLIHKVIDMHNFVAKFGKNLTICEI